MDNIFVVPDVTFVVMDDTFVVMDDTFVVIDDTFVDIDDTFVSLVLFKSKTFRILIGIDFQIYHLEDKQTIIILVNPRKKHK